MKSKPPHIVPEIVQEPASVLPEGLDGSRSIATLVADAPGAVTVLGKETIKDLGARLRQISGLKPGRSSIRSQKIIDELLQRLLEGENLVTITLDPHMPAVSTLSYWRRDDYQLDQDIRWAMAEGQSVLYDIAQNIAAGGEFSTGDARRDELLIKVITITASKRNRADFGDKVQVEHSQTVINLPDRAKLV